MSGFQEFYKISEHDQNANVESIFLKKPVIVGLLEKEVDSEIKVPTSICVRYFKLPKQQCYPLDLNHGFENYVFQSENYFKYNLENIYHFLKVQDTKNNGNKASDRNKETKGDHGGDQEQIEIISDRNALEAILKVPYSKSYGIHKNDFTLHATVYNKKLFLCKIGDYRGRQNEPKYTYHDKFAQYCFSDDPEHEPDTSAPIYAGEKIRCIYRSQLKNFNLLYCGELNGILSDRKVEDEKNYEELNKYPFVLTKTLKKEIRNWKKNFRILGWWANAYLSAVDDVYVGFRDSLGFVNDPVQHVSLHKIIREQRWSPKVCNAFLYKMLNMIVQELKDVNCPYTTYEFHFDSERYLIELKKHEGKTDKTFLSDEYIEYIMNND